MKDPLQLAQDIRGEIISNRRTLHSFAETGFAMDRTLPFVMDQLKSYGYTPIQVGKAGVGCTVGKPGKTILFRADMDALPMRENSGLPFAATNGNAHACGHDSHTAMLLGAAKLLKQNEADLDGTVKFMFQPAEEILAGAKDMITHGILEDPAPDAAFALHIAVGKEETRSGTLFYKPGYANKSSDALEITVHGKDSHGSRAYLGVDSILIAAHIITVLSQLVGKEIPSGEDCSVLVGKIRGGTSANSVAGETVLDVTVRTCDSAYRTLLLKRIPEIASQIAGVYRGTVTCEHVLSAPAMYNDEQLAGNIEEWIKDLLSKDRVYRVQQLAGGEDFAEIAARIPSAQFFLNCGCWDEGYTASIHQPDMVLNEDVLPVGTAVFLQVAANWFRA